MASTTPPTSTNLPDGRSTRPVRVVAVVRDLMTATRLEGAVVAAGGTMRRVDSPDQLPPATDVDVVVVDWSERADGWAPTLAAWRDGLAGVDPAPRIILFGPHTDLAAHGAAREAGLGPMRARSALFAGLPGLLDRSESLAPD